MADMTDPTRKWGYFLADGGFVELPKQSLRLAGYTQPPFDVTRPDGTLLHVVEHDTETSAPRRASAPDSMPDSTTPREAPHAST